MEFNKQKIIRGLNAIKDVRNILIDDQAFEYSDIYPEWSANSPGYTVGYRVLYENNLYKCLQAHTPQQAWTPAAAPSLWAAILGGQGGTTPQQWQQPDSTNPYMTGDKCYYNGILYESIIDNNVWSPVDYPAGWKVIVE